MPRPCSRLHQSLRSQTSPAMRAPRRETPGGHRVHLPALRNRTAANGRPGTLQAAPPLERWVVKPCLAISAEAEPPDRMAFISCFLRDPQIHPKWACFFEASDIILITRKQWREGEFPLIHTQSD